MASGTCAFTQDCFQSGVDTACTPRAFLENESTTSFVQDDAHGFGVPHPKVWAGALVNPDTGLCAAGSPDAQGHCIEVSNMLTCVERETLFSIISVSTAAVAVVNIACCIVVAISELMQSQAVAVAVIMHNLRELAHLQVHYCCACS
jgi:hypothetical protein